MRTATGCPTVAFERLPDGYAQAAIAAGVDAAEDRANFDYVYRREDLAELAGRRYHAKRNLVAQCLAQNACVYEEIGPGHIAEMRDSYHLRRNFIVSSLNEMGLDCFMPRGAFYVFPSIGRFGLPSGEFCRRMIKEAGLAATPGACFGGEGHIRLSYCYSEDALREGLSRLERFTETF